MQKNMKFFTVAVGRALFSDAIRKPLFKHVNSAPGTFCKTSRAVRALELRI